MGQFSAPGGDQWGLLLQKDSPLTTCLDQALMSHDELGRAAGDHRPVDRRGRRAGAGVAPRTAELSRREVREAAKRRQARRGAGIAAFSTALVLTVVVVGITSSPGWDDVKALFFSWDDFKEAFPDVLRGFWLDVKLFVVVEILVLILGLLVALSRGAALARRCSRCGCSRTVYTDVFRGLPVILVIYAIGFGVPALVTPGTVPELDARPGGARRRSR